MVEDEDRVRILATEILQQAGCTVLPAKDGLEALRVAENCPHPPTVLITDVVMPGIGGPELAQTLQKRWPGLPVVYASGYTEHALLGHSVLQQNMPFLQKPYTADDLLDQVARSQEPRV